MEKIIGSFNVVCVTESYGGSDTRWHVEKTGKADVIEKPVSISFPSNEGMETPLANLTYQVVRFQGEESLLTCVTDGLDGMAVCLMVKPFGCGADWLKLFTDTPTPKGKTSEAVRENARQTIEHHRSSRSRSLRW